MKKKRKNVQNVSTVLYVLKALWVLKKVIGTLGTTYVKTTVYTKVHFKSVAEEGNWISDMRISNSTFGHLHFSRVRTPFFFSNEAFSYPQVKVEKKNH